MTTNHWNTPVKYYGVAVAPNQLYVDDQRTVWQWDATAKAWIRRANMYLKEVDRWTLNLDGFGVGTPLQNGAPPYLVPVWEDLYSKCFLEFSFPLTNPPNVYRSHANLADLQERVRGLTPNDGILYTDNCVIKIFQVIDPSYQVSRVSYHNRLYSQLRNGESFNRRHGRQHVGMYQTSGYDVAFTATGSGWFTDTFVDPYQSFLQIFFGVTAPGSDPFGDRCVWSRQTKKLFRHPKEGSCINCGSLGRYAWDVGTSAFVLDNSGSNYYVGTPKVMWSAHYDTKTRWLEEMSALRGLKLFNNPRSVMLVYPLTRIDLPNPRYAFLCKPLGVDTFGFGYNADPLTDRLIMEKVSKRGWIRRSQVNLAYAQPYDEWDQLTGFDSRILEIPYKSGMRTEDPAAPDIVQFYLYDSVSGKRGEIIDQKFKFVRNKCHVTIDVEPLGR